MDNQKKSEMLFKINFFIMEFTGIYPEKEKFLMDAFGVEPEAEKIIYHLLRTKKMPLLDGKNWKIKDANSSRK